MKHFVIVIIMVSAVMFLLGCSKEHQDLPTSFAFDPPPTPTNFDVVGGPYEAVLTWDYPPEEMGALKEFRVYYYYEIYGMVELIGTTHETSYTDAQLVGNLIYCYRVSAVDTTDLEGYRTQTVCDTVVTP
jgi:hypothetical protein